MPKRQPTPAPTETEKPLPPEMEKIRLELQEFSAMDEIDQNIYIEEMLENMTSEQLQQAARRLSDFIESPNEDELH